MIFILIFLFLITGLMPFLGLIISEKIEIDTVTKNDIKFLSGFITGIIESLLLFSFMLIAFIGFKNSTGG